MASVRAHQTLQNVHKDDMQPPCIGEDAPRGLAGKRLDTSSDEEAAQTPNAATPAAQQPRRRPPYAPAATRNSFASGDELRPTTPPTGAQARSRTPADWANSTDPRQQPLNPHLNTRTTGGYNEPAQGSSLAPMAVVKSRRHTVAGPGALQGQGPQQPPPPTASKSAAMRDLDASSDEEDEQGGMSVSQQQVPAADAADAASARSSRTAQPSRVSLSSRDPSTAGADGQPTSRSAMAANTIKGVRASSVGRAPGGAGGAPEATGKPPPQLSRLRRVSSNGSLASDRSRSESLASSRLTQPSSRVSAGVQRAVARQRLDSSSGSSSGGEDVGEDAAAAAVAAIAVPAAEAEVGSPAGAAANLVVRARQEAAAAATSRRTTASSAVLRASRGHGGRASVVSDKESEPGVALQREPSHEGSRASSRMQLPDGSASRANTVRWMEPEVNDASAGYAMGVGPFTDGLMEANLSPRMLQLAASASREVASVAAATLRPLSLISGSPVTSPHLTPRLISASGPAAAPPPPPAHALQPNKAPPAESASNASDPEAWPSSGGVLPVPAAKAVFEQPPAGVDPQLNSAKRIASWLAQQPHPESMSEVPSAGGTDDLSEYAATLAGADLEGASVVLPASASTAALAAAGTVLSAGAARGSQPAIGSAGGNSSTTAATGAAVAGLAAGRHDRKASRKGSRGGSSTALDAVAGSDRRESGPVAAASPRHRHHVRLTVSSSSSGDNRDASSDSGSDGEPQRKARAVAVPVQQPHQQQHAAAAAAPSTSSAAPSVAARRLDFASSSSGSVDSGPAPILAAPRAPPLVPSTKPAAAVTPSAPSTSARSSPSFNESIPGPTPPSAQPTAPTAAPFRSSTVPDALPAARDADAEQPTASARPPSPSANRIASAGSLRQLAAAAAGGRMASSELRAMLSALARPAWSSIASANLPMRQDLAARSTASSTPSAGPSPRGSTTGDSGPQPFSYNELLHMLRAVSSSSGSMAALIQPYAGNMSPSAGGSRAVASPRATTSLNGTPPRTSTHRSRTAVSTAASLLAATKNHGSVAASPGTVRGPSGGSGSSAAQAPLATVGSGSSSQLAEHPMAAPIESQWSGSTEQQQRDYAELVRLWTQLTGRRPPSTSFSGPAESAGQESDPPSPSIASTTSSAHQQHHQTAAPIGSARSPAIGASPAVSRSGVPASAARPPSPGGLRVGGMHAAAALAASAAAMATSAVLSAASQSSGSISGTSVFARQSPQRQQPHTPSRITTTPLPSPQPSHHRPPIDPTTPRGVSAVYAALPAELQHLARIISAASHVEQASAAISHAETDMQRLARLLAADTSGFLPTAPAPAAAPDSAPAASLGMPEVDLQLFMRLLTAVAQQGPKEPASIASNLVAAATEASAGPAPASASAPALAAPLVSPTVATSVSAPAPSASKQHSVGASVGGMHKTSSSASLSSPSPVPDAPPASTTTAPAVPGLTQPAETKPQLESDSAVEASSPPRSRRSSGDTVITGQALSRMYTALRDLRLQDKSGQTEPLTLTSYSQTADGDVQVTRATEASEPPQPGRQLVVPQAVDSTASAATAEADVQVEADLRGSHTRSHADQTEQPTVTAAAQQTEEAQSDGTQTGQPAVAASAQQTDEEPPAVDTAVQTAVSKVRGGPNRGVQTEEELSANASQTTVSRLGASFPSAAVQTDAEPSTLSSEAQTDLVRVQRTLSAAGQTEREPEAAAPNSATGVVAILRMLSVGGPSPGDAAAPTLPSPALALPVPEVRREITRALRMLSVGGTVYMPQHLGAGVIALPAIGGVAGVASQLPPVAALPESTSLSAAARADLVRALPALAITAGEEDKEAPASSSYQQLAAVQGTQLSDAIDKGLFMGLAAQQEVLRALQMLSSGGALQLPTEEPAASDSSGAIIPGGHVTLSGQARVEVGRALRLLSAGGTVYMPSYVAAGSVSPTSSSGTQTVVTRALRLPSGQVLELDPIMPLLSNEAAVEEAAAALDQNAANWLQALRALNSALGDTPTSSDLPTHGQLTGASGPTGGSEGALLRALQMLSSADVGGDASASSGAQLADWPSLQPTATSSLAPARLPSSVTSTVECETQTDLTGSVLASLLQSPFPPAQGLPDDAASTLTEPNTSITAGPIVPAATHSFQIHATASSNLTSTPAGAAFTLRNLPIASDGGVMDAPHQGAVHGGRIGSSGGMLAYLEAADPTTATAMMELVQALQLMTLNARRRRWVSDGSSAVSGVYFPGAEPPSPPASNISSLGGSFVTSVGPSISQAGQLSIPGAPRPGATGPNPKAITVGGKSPAAVAAGLPPRPRATTEPPSKHLERALRAVSGGGAGRAASSGGSSGASAAAPPAAASAAEVHITRALDLLSHGSAAAGLQVPPTVPEADEEAELHAQEELVAALMALLTSKSPQQRPGADSLAQPTEQPVQPATAPTVAGHEKEPSPASSEDESAPAPPAPPAAPAVAQEPAAAAVVDSAAAPEEDASVVSSDASSGAAAAELCAVAALHSQIQVAMEQAASASERISTMLPADVPAAELLDGVPFDQAIGYIMSGLHAFDGGPVQLARHLHLMYLPSSGGASSTGQSMGGAARASSPSSAAAAAAALAAAVSSVADSRRQTSVGSSGSTPASVAEEEQAPAVGLSDEDKERVHALVSAAAAAVAAFERRASGLGAADEAADANASPFATEERDAVTALTAALVAHGASSAALPVATEQLALSPVLAAGSTRSAPQPLGSIAAEEEPAIDEAASPAGQPSPSASPLRLIEHIVDMGASAIAQLLPSSDGAPGLGLRSAPVTSAGAATPPQLLPPAMHTFGGALDLTSDATAQQPPAPQWTAILPCGGLDEQLRPVGPSLQLPALSAAVAEAPESPVGRPPVRVPTFATPSAPAVRGSAVSQSLPVSLAGASSSDGSQPQVPSAAAQTDGGAICSATAPEPEVVSAVAPPPESGATPESSAQVAAPLPEPNSAGSCTTGGKEAVSSPLATVADQLTREACAPAPPAGTATSMPPPPARAEQETSDVEIPMLTAMDRFKTRVHVSPYRVASQAASPAQSAGGAPPPPQAPSVAVAATPQPQRALVSESDDTDSSIAAVPLARDVMTGRRVTAPQWLPADSAGRAHARRALFSAGGEESSSAQAEGPAKQILSRAAALLLDAMQTAAEGQPEQEAALQLLSPVLEGLVGGSKAETRAGAQSAPVTMGGAYSASPVQPQQSSPGALVLPSGGEAPGHGAQDVPPAATGLAVTVPVPQSEAGQEAEEALMPFRSDGCAFSFALEAAEAAVASTPAGVVMGPRSSAELQPQRDGQEAVADTDASSDALQPPNVATTADLEAFKEDIMGSVRTALLEIVDLIGSTVLQRTAGAAQGPVDAAPAPQAQVDGSDEEIRITRTELEAFMFNKALLSSDTSADDLLGTRLRDMYAQPQQLQGGDARPASPTTGVTSSGSSSSSLSQQPQLSTSPRRTSAANSAGSDADSEADGAVPRDSSLRQPLGDGAFKSLFRRSMEHLRGHLHPPHPTRNPYLHQSIPIAGPSSVWAALPDPTAPPAHVPADPASFSSASHSPTFAATATATATTGASTPDSRPPLPPRNSHQSAPGAPPAAPSSIAPTAARWPASAPGTSPDAELDVTFGPAISAAASQQAVAAHAAVAAAVAAQVEASNRAADDVELDEHLAARLPDDEALDSMTRWPDPTMPSPRTTRDTQPELSAGTLHTEDGSPGGRAVSEFLAALAEPVPWSGAAGGSTGVVVEEELSAEGISAFGLLPYAQDASPLRPPPLRPSRVPGFSNSGSGAANADADADWDEDEVVSSPLRARSEAHLPIPRLRLQHPSLRQAPVSRSAFSTPIPGSSHGGSSKAALPASPSTSLPANAALPALPHNQNHTPSRLKMASAPGAGVDVGESDRSLMSYKGAASEGGRSGTPPRSRPRSPSPLARSSTPSRPVSPPPSEAAARQPGARMEENGDAAEVAEEATVQGQPSSTQQHEHGKTQASTSLRELESYLSAFKSRMQAAQEEEEKATLAPMALPRAPVGNVSPGAAAPQPAAAPCAAISAAASDAGDGSDDTTLSAVGVATGFNLYTIRASAASAFAAATAVKQVFAHDSSGGSSEAASLEHPASVASAGLDNAAGAKSVVDRDECGPEEPADVSACSVATPEYELQEAAALTEPAVTPAPLVPATSTVCESAASSATTTPTNPLLREHLEHFQALLDKANDLVDRLMVADDAASDASDATPHASELPATTRSARASTRRGPHAHQPTPASLPMPPASLASPSPVTASPMSDVAATPAPLPSLAPELAAMFPATAARLRAPSALMQQSPSAMHSLVDSAVAAVPQLAAGAERARSLSSTPMTRSPVGSVGGGPAALPSRGFRVASGTPVAGHHGTPQHSTPLVLVAELLATAHSRMEFRSLEEQRGADKILSAVLDEHFAQVLGTPRGFLTPPRPAAAPVHPPVPMDSPTVTAPRVSRGGAVGEALLQAAAEEEPTRPDAGAAAAGAEGPALLPETAASGAPSRRVTSGGGEASLPPSRRTTSAGEPAAALAPASILQGTFQPADARVSAVELAGLPGTAITQARVGVPQPHAAPKPSEVDAELARMMQQRSDLLSSALDAVHQVAATTSGGGAPPAPRPADPTSTGGASAISASTVDLPGPFATQTLPSELVRGDSRSSDGSMGGLPLVPPVLTVAATSMGLFTLPRPLFPYQEYDSESTRTSYNVSLAGSARHLGASVSHEHEPPGWLRAAADSWARGSMQPVSPSIGGASTVSELHGASSHPLPPLPPPPPSRALSAASGSANGRDAVRASLNGGNSFIGAGVNLGHLMESDSDDGASASGLSASISLRAVAPVIPGSMAFGSSAPRNDSEHDTGVFGSAVATADGSGPSTEVAGCFGVPRAPGTDDGSSSDVSMYAAGAMPYTSSMADAAAVAAVVRALQNHVEGTAVPSGSSPLRGSTAGVTGQDTSAGLNDSPSRYLPSRMSGGGTSVASAATSTFDPETRGTPLRYNPIYDPADSSHGGASVRSLHHETSYTPLAAAAAAAVAEARGSSAASSNSGDEPSLLHARLLSAGGTSCAVLDPNPAFGMHEDAEEVPTHLQVDTATLRQPRFSASSFGILPLSPIGEVVNGGVPAAVSPATVLSAPGGVFRSSGGGDLAPPAAGSATAASVLTDSSETEGGGSFLLDSGLSEGQLAMLKAAPELPGSRQHSAVAPRVDLIARSLGGASTASAASSALGLPTPPVGATGATAGMVSRGGASNARQFGRLGGVDAYSDGTFHSTPFTHTLGAAAMAPKTTTGGSSDEGSSFDFEEISREAEVVATTFSTPREREPEEEEPAGAADPLNSTIRLRSTGGSAAASEAVGPFPLASLLPAAGFGQAAAGGNGGGGFGSVTGVFGPGVAAASGFSAFEAPVGPLAAVSESSDEASEAGSVQQQQQQRAHGPAGAEATAAEESGAVRQRGLVAAAIRRIESSADRAAGGSGSLSVAIPLASAYSGPGVESPKPSFKPAGRPASGIPKPPSSPGGAAAAAHLAAVAMSPATSRQASSLHSSRRSSITSGSEELAPPVVTQQQQVAPMAVLAAAASPRADDAPFVAAEASSFFEADGQPELSMDFATEDSSAVLGVTAEAEPQQLPTVFGHLDPARSTTTTSSPLSCAPASGSTTVSGQVPQQTDGAGAARVGSSPVTAGRGKGKVGSSSAPTGVRPGSPAQSPPLRASSGAAALALARRAGRGQGSPGRGGGRRGGSSAAEGGAGRSPSPMGRGRGGASPGRGTTASPSRIPVGPRAAEGAQASGVLAGQQQQQSPMKLHEAVRAYRNTRRQQT